MHFLCCAVLCISDGLTRQHWWLLRWRWWAVVSHWPEMLREMASCSVPWGSSDPHDISWMQYSCVGTASVGTFLVLCLQSTEHPRVITSCVPGGSLWSLVNVKANSSGCEWAVCVTSAGRSTLAWLSSRLLCTVHISEGITGWIHLGVNWGAVPRVQTYDSVFSPCRTP